MTDPHPGPEDEPPEPPEPLPVPGDVVEGSKLAARRPHVERLRVVRTGRVSATVYLGWPDSPGSPPTAVTVYERARVLAHATGREDHLLQTSPLRVQVHLHSSEPEITGAGMEVLMDLSGLPTARIEMHFYALEPTPETLDWFLDAAVATSWALTEGAGA